MAIPTALLQRDTAGTVPINVVIGDTINLVGNIQVDGVNQDISVGCTVAAKILASDGGAVLKTFTCTITDGPTGAIKVYLSPANSLGLPTPASDGAQIGVWDIDITDGTDTITFTRGSVFGFFPRH